MLLRLESERCLLVTLYQLEGGPVCFAVVSQRGDKLHSRLCPDIHLTPHKTCVKNRKLLSTTKSQPSA